MKYLFGFGTSFEPLGLTTRKQTQKGIALLQQKSLELCSSLVRSHQRDTLSNLIQYKQQQTRITG